MRQVSYVVLWSNYLHPNTSVQSRSHIIMLLCQRLFGHSVVTWYSYKYGPKSLLVDVSAFTPMFLFLSLLL